jgi:hypothetical protein
VLDDDDYVKVHEAMARRSYFARDTSADELRADVEGARLFFVARKKLNEDTDRRRRELFERPAAFKQA